ncbi:hypothetical protein phiV141_16 [Vibrio phage phiV141]|uniref:Uncharacterized protein n=1 Tax=Vibrio phage phiV141 TaxID=2723905 RepID=A0A7D7JVN6_9CAUD|nr:hypothetical protein phiV141_16 [Vibrio phage phiV141]
MKSKIEDLQCPCGCELGVPHRLELLYHHLVAQGYEVTGLVNCESGVHSQVTFRVKDIHPDAVNKHIMQLRKELGFDVLVWFDQAEMQWLCDVNYKHGVMYA